MNVKLVIKRPRRRPIELLAVFHMQTAALLIQYLQMIFIELKVSGWPFKIKETLVCFSNAWQLIRCEMMYLNCKTTSQTIRAVFQQPQNEFFQHISTDSLMTGFQTSNGGWIDQTKVRVSRTNWKELICARTSFTANSRLHCRFSKYLFAFRCDAKVNGAFTTFTSGTKLKRIISLRVWPIKIGCDALQQVYFTPVSLRVRVLGGYQFLEQPWSLAEAVYYVYLHCIFFRSRLSHRFWHFDL